MTLGRLWPSLDQGQIWLLGLLNVESWNNAFFCCYYSLWYWNAVNFKPYEWGRSGSLMLLYGQTVFRNWGCSLLKAHKALWLQKLVSSQRKQNDQKVHITWQFQSSGSNQDLVVLFFVVPHLFGDQWQTWYSCFHASALLCFLGSTSVFPWFRPLW